MTAGNQRNKKSRFSLTYMLNKKGFSLVELLISVAVIGGLALVVTRLTQQSEKSAKKLDVNSDITNTVNEIGGILTDPRKCKLTFATPGGSPTDSWDDVREPIAIVNGMQEIPSGDPSIPPSYNINSTKFQKMAATGEGGYGASKVKLTNYVLEESADGLVNEGGVLVGEETFLITFKNKKILEGSGGGDDIVRRLTIYVERKVADDSLITCRSLTNSMALIWQRGQGTDIFYSGGNVGINTSMPDAALDVDGDIRADNIIAQTFLYSSDVRLKKNIDSIVDPISKIKKLRGVTFDWKTNNRHDYGFIAQEVRETLPELVTENSPQNLLTVDYAKVVPVLLEAIKKQNEQLESLEKEIENLK